MKNFTMLLLALFIVCSTDGGKTRTFYRNAHRIFYAEQCLVWECDQIDGQVAACGQGVECVVAEGEVPPPGTPSDDYLKQESTGTVKQ